MMSFYLKPPRGEINFHTLEECVQQRVNCYQNLGNGNGASNDISFEYLLEDGILDRTGHFMFRLGVLRGYVSKKLFLTNELQLLNIRLNYYDKNDMELFLRKIIRQLKDCIRLHIGKHLTDFYWTLYKVTSRMSTKEYLSHIYEKHMNEDDILQCSDNLCISIPFWYCNSYIAKRAVDVHKGCAIFDCTKWRHIISTLFTSHLKIVLIEMKYSKNVFNSFSDERIMGCLQLLKNQYLKNEYQNESTLQLRNIDEESIYFPLCMKNLYCTLKKNHRLAHNDRFDLSLFLKDIGFSLNDSLKFWESEYNQQHSACSKCSHTWQKNEAKYIYSIRHLYGLEGSRKNYQGRSCSHLQDTGVGIGSEGGCPFVHYDDDHLRSALKRNLPGLEDDIEVIIFERKENATFACKLYGECILKKLNQNLSLENKEISNPSQFFRILKEKEFNLK